MVRGTGYNSLMMVLLIRHAWGIPYELDALLRGMWLCFMPILLPGADN